MYNDQIKAIIISVFSNIYHLYAWETLDSIYFGYTLDSCTNTTQLYYRIQELIILLFHLITTILFSSFVRVTCFCFLNQFIFVSIDYFIYYMSSNSMYVATNDTISLLLWMTISHSVYVQNSLCSFGQQQKYGLIPYLGECK